MVALIMSHANFSVNQNQQSNETDVQDPVQVEIVEDLDESNDDEKVDQTNSFSFGNEDSSQEISNDNDAVIVEISVDNAEKEKPNPGVSQPEPNPAPSTEPAPIPQPTEPGVNNPEPTPNPLPDPGPATEPVPAPLPEPDPTPDPTPEIPPVVEEKHFDVDYYITFAQKYAVSVGLNLDSSATDCWDNPIRANINCTNLETDIRSRMNRYAKDEDITDVWIWYEDIGGGNYNIYIGYA